MGLFAQVLWRLIAGGSGIQAVDGGDEDTEELFLRRFVQQGACNRFKQTVTEQVPNPHIRGRTVGSSGMNEHTIRHHHVSDRTLIGTVL